MRSRSFSISISTAAALGAFGCGGAAPPLAIVASSSDPAASSPPPRIAAAYEPWQVDKGCEVRALDPHALCAGQPRCPVARDDVARCGATIANLTLAPGGTAVFGFTRDTGNRTSGFGYWSSGDPVRAVSSDGAEEVAAAQRPGGPLHVVRAEQGRLVDYRIDPLGLGRRRWDYPLPPETRLIDAAWDHDRLIARTLERSSEGDSYTRDVVARPDGAFAGGDTSSLIVPWPPGLLPKRAADGHAYSLSRGSSGVAIRVDGAILRLPEAVSRTMRSPQILLPEAAAPAPTFAFRSFDPSDRNGVHVLFLRAPLSGSAPSAVTDLHFLAGRQGRQSDCRETRDSKPGLCTSTETSGSGGALARTSDGTAWLAFLVTERQHQAITQVVCPPPPTCAPGEPCRQAPCERRERNPHDTVRHRLFVVRLAADGRGAALGFLSELVEAADASFFEAPAMSAEGALLHLVLNVGDRKLRRIALDTAAMNAAPLLPDSLVVTETELQSEK